jgi:hypothetical protein
MPMKNLVKNSAIIFLFIATMYLLFAFENYLLFKIVFVIFLLFCTEMVWRVIQKERIKNPDYVAKQVAKSLKKWREDAQFWIDRQNPEYIQANNQFNEFESIYFKLWEKFLHDKNKRLEIVRDWATFIESQLKALAINSNDIDPESKKKYDYLQIRIEEIKKRFDKLNKE